MRRALHGAILVVGILLSGCVQIQFGGPLRADLRGNDPHIHIIRHAPDEHQLTELIAHFLEQSGVSTVTSGSREEARPDGIDLELSYEDHWKRDLYSYYLLFLRLDVRDPETGSLLGSTAAFNDGATGMSAGDFAEQVVGLLMGIDP